MDLTTTTYQQETPGWLWRAFTQGPAAEYDRYDERITRLIAVDVLVHCREDLTERERRFAIELATEVHYVDVDV